MAFSVVLLTLILPVAAQAGLDLTQTMERFPLKGPARDLSARAEPIAGRVVIEGPGAAGLAKELRAATRTLCTEVSVQDEAVVLKCKSRFIAASIAPHAGGQSVEVRFLRVAPWSGRDGLPLVPFDPFRLDLGASCPGDTPAGSGECALAAGQPKVAAEHFKEVTGGPGAALAALRLGDIAAFDGDLAEAVRHWRQVPPRSLFGRLAAVRLCETEPDCLPASRSSILYDPNAVHVALRPDLVLRRARVEAFHGRALEGAQMLTGEYGVTGACTAEPLLCGDILLDALRAPGARGTQALATYLATPSRDRGPVSIELARAASEHSMAAGAPLFAANLLSVVSGTVPLAQLPDHLARTAELYLEGGDLVRASVVVDFARTRLGQHELASARWIRITRASSTRPLPKAAAPRADVTGVDAELDTARRAVDKTRTSLPGSPP
jgi:hypothetical protein